MNVLLHNCKDAMCQVLLKLEKLEIKVHDAASRCRQTRRFLALDSGELMIHQTKQNPKIGDKANNYFISVLFFFGGFLRRSVLKRVEKPSH